MANFGVSYNINFVDQFSEVAKSLQKSLDGVHEKLDAMAKQSKKAASGLEKVGNEFKKLGKYASVVSIPLAAGLGLGIKKFSEFDVAMRATGIVTGATAEQYQKLKDQVWATAVSTTFSTKEIADAQRVAFARLQDVNKTLEATPIAAKLALATQGDLANTTLGLTKIMYIWGNQAGSISHVANVMAEGFRQTGKDAGTLAQAFGYAGPQARAAGLDFNMAAAALISIAKAEGRPTIAGMQMRQVLSKLEAPSKNSIAILHKAAAAYGYHANALIASNGKIKDFVGLMDLLSKVGPRTFAKIIPDVRAKEFVQVFNQNRDAVLKLYNTMKNDGTIVSRLAQEQMDGMAGSMRRLRSATSVLEQKVIDVQSTPITGFISKLADLVGAMATSDSGTQKVIATFWDLGAVLGPVLLTIGKVCIFLKFMGKAAAIDWVINALGVSFQFLWKSMLGPIGLMLVAGALLDKLYKKSKIFREGLDWLGNSLAKVAGPLAPFVKVGFQAGKVGQEKLLGKLGLDPHLFGDIGMPAQKSDNAISARVSAAHSNAAKTTHSVQSNLHITVDDSQGIVKSIKGSSSGSMTFNLSRNMAHYAAGG